METQTNEKMNVKNVPKLESKRLTQMTPIELAIVTIVAGTGYLLQILTVWSWHKEINAPVAPPQKQAVSTINGTLTTTTLQV